MPIIVADKCRGCRLCIPCCPVDAFKLVGRKRVDIDQSVCVECYVCLRKTVCPYEAIEPARLEGTLRNFSHFLSDPTETKAATGVPGRGTEESKTNDVTGRTKIGQVGFTIDMGRPGVGVHLVDVQTVAMALAEAGLEFEDNTPLTDILVDRATGRIQPEYLPVHLLSIIIEGHCQVERFPAIIQALRGVERRVNTVFSVGVISRVDAMGNTPVLAEMDRCGLPRPVRGKVNVGLGRPLVTD